MSSADTARIREIPYNYTSFSDREIVSRFLGEDSWRVIESLREQRRTGQSARMLFEILGDMWVITRNPFIQDDLLQNKKRRKALIEALHHRLAQIDARADNNDLALDLIAKTRDAIERFAMWFPQQNALRKRILKEFSAVTRKSNVDCSGLARVSHVTDATDWRVEFPVVVLYPDKEEELPDLIEVCNRLDLVVIARGGGTGYTGGAVPLHDNTVVINTEKLDSVGSVTLKTFAGQNQKVATIRAGAGAITKSVADAAAAAGYVFAVDPTSQDSSTIGGNIAMNAGGKKAVLWGTTIDNLVSWSMVTAQGNWLKVERINHNLSKIHEQEQVQFRLRYYDTRQKKQLGDAQDIIVPGSAFRKAGLGKDVTDKFLSGIPGIQKEGCDGLISSAEFILHQYPAHIHTVCLEFYGQDLRVAVPAIVEVKDHIDNTEGVVLSGLEHLDERYVKAIQYAPKSVRADFPKMVLLIDVASDDKNLLESTINDIMRLAQARNAEAFVAVSSEARRQFWADRARTAAIAAHTNAFKINEDVVIPLDRLAAYAEGIERINIEQSIKNKIAIVQSVMKYLQQSPDEIARLSDYDDSEESRKIISAKITAAQTLCEQVVNRWQTLADNLDESARRFAELLSDMDGDASAELGADVTLVELLYRRQLVVSYRKEIERPLKEFFTGKGFVRVQQKFDALHAQIRASRLFVATHMHAGDGNVHTNIPVNSNDYAMLQEAYRIVDRVMHLAQSLDGVISGEHGIGMTKVEYLSDDALQKFSDYKTQVDPEQRFNRNKLSESGGLERAYTPSLRLLQMEALILEESELGRLNDAIRHCLRCGKCKPVCNTHIPRANLNYSPRNKILATGLIIEAFLYEEQTRRGISLNHFDEMNDIADHCTVCHKCLTPCPVNIDFGEVSITMRNILSQRNKKTWRPGTWLSITFLNLTHPRWIRWLRFFMVRLSFPIQRLMYKLFLPFSQKNSKQPEPTGGKPALGSQIVNFVAKPLPAKVPRKPLRQILQLEDTKYVPILRDPQKVDAQSEAVFYFPGCGSERLYSQIGLATLGMLYESGVYTVLPPSYLCCGYPQTSSGDEARGQRITTENRVLFHRIANTLNYLDIQTVVVSCGTCMDQMLKYDFEQIFPGCRLLDIHEYLYEKNMQVQVTDGTRYLYHDPCHTPMKTYQPLQVASSLLGQPVKGSDRCCGEAGTFAVSRPDIATQVRFRKLEELTQGKQELQRDAADTNLKVKVLTACPSCQQGLAAYEPATQMGTDYIVVEMIKQRLGEQWEDKVSQSLSRDGIERVLL